MTHLHRRTLLKAAMGSVLAAPAWARSAGRAAEEDRILVLLQLKGGNDGLDTLVPHEDPLYHAARPTIRLRDGLHRVDDLNALNPQMPRLARHCREGRVAFLQNVGHSRPNLSHFRSQDMWDTATVDGSLPATGWVGRYCDENHGGDAAMRMVAVGRDATPLSLRSEDYVACTLRDLESFQIRAAPERSPAGDIAARRRALKALHRPLGGGDAYTEAVDAAAVSLGWMSKVEGFSAGTSFPRTRIGVELELCARIIGRGVPTNVLHVAQSGYDTHTTQRATQDRLLRELDTALDAFLQELQRQGNLERVLVMTVSEFGRRVRESGVGVGAGTDHGASSLMMFLGAGVRPGVHGGQPDLRDLDDDGNLRHQVDFRQAYATVIEGWLGGKARPVLGADYPKVPVLG